MTIQQGERAIKEISTYRKAALAAFFADEKKGEDIVVLDLKGLCTFTDAFVIVTANNRIQLNAIGDQIVMGFKKRGHKPPVGDEERASNWKVLDYGDVVIHLMSTEARAFYGLERLWGDGTPIDWQEVLREAGEAVPTPGN